MPKDRVKIWGGPGTGKTTYLINIVEQEMLRGIQPNEIVFSTFTRAAAHEARNRAMDRFGGDYNDYPYFNTEHSICYRLLGLERGQVFNRGKLRDFGEKYGYEYSWNGGGGSLETRYQEAMLQTVADYYEFFIHFMRDSMLTYDEAYRKFVHGNDVPKDFERVSLLQYIERRNQYKQEYRLWDFDDMIQGVFERHLIPEGMRVLILDEMQDSSKLLWELAKMWADNAERVYIAGDPLQTLYFWSGASPELFFEFEAEEEVLKVSHRLTNQVKDLAERIILKTKYPFPGFRSSGRDGQILRASFADISWDKVGSAFLLIRTRYLISQAVEYFLSVGIPFSSERSKQSPLMTGLGNAFHTLLRIKDDEPIATAELVELTKFTKRPFIEYGAKASIRRLDNRMYHRKHLKGLGFTDNFLGAINDNPQEILCLGIDQDDRSYLSRLFRRYGKEVFQKEPDLTITTIHGSKGREKPNVFVSPDMTMRVWDGYLKNRDPEALVSYVAVTRTMGNLTMLTPQASYSYPYPKIT